MSSKNHEYKQFMLDFIQVYRQLPALWDRKSVDYNNRVTKAEQYEVLVEKYRERYSDASKVDVVRKINSLRTNFRKELKRVRDAETYGGQAVESSQWYFEAISFLDSDATTDDSISTEHAYCVPEQSEECKLNMSTAEDVGTLIKIEVEPAKKPRATKEEIDSQNDLVETASYERLQEGPDDNEILAAAWAVELRSMHWQQQLLAKKAINDILFEGQMGTLHRHSVEINATRGRAQSRSPIEHKSANYYA